MRRHKGTSTNERHNRAIVCLSGTTAALHGPPRMRRTILSTVHATNGPKQNTRRPALRTDHLICTTQYTVTGLLRTPSPSYVTFTTGTARTLGVTLKNLFTPNSRVVAAMYRRGSILQPLCQLQRRNLRFDFTNISRHKQLRCSS